MAGSASHVGVAIGQQEPSRAVVELGVQPSVKVGVTGLAGGRKFCRHVIGIGCSLKIIQVTRRAGGRESHILSDRCILVTLLAFHHGVGTEERKSIEVIFNRLHRYIPAQGSVAFGAIGAVLAAMNVSVAVRAVLADVSKYRLEVALGAVHLFVHPAEGIPGAVVAELRDPANWRPTRARVAVLARDVERAVRTATGLPLGIRWRSTGKCDSKKNDPATDLEYSRNSCPHTI